MEDLMLQAAFRAPAGEWHRVRLAFQDFITTVRGMEAEAQVLELPNRVTRVGVLSAERRAGPFRLELDWIKLVSLEASHRGRYRLGIKHPRRAYEQAQAIEVPNPAPSLSAPDLQFRTSNSPPFTPPPSLYWWLDVWRARLESIQGPAVYSYCGTRLARSRRRAHTGRKRISTTKHAQGKDQLQLVTTLCQLQQQQQQQPE